MGQAVSLQSGAERRDISFTYEPPKESVYLQVDPGQIRQALTNLLQNAADAIEARQEQERTDGKEVRPDL